MRGAHFLIAAVLIGVSPSDQTASAAELCTASYLRGCDNPVDNELCLKKLYACGAYDTIIAAYDAQALAPNPLGNYYMGVSYYGLSIRTRAQSYRCAYVEAGRSQLLTFLDTLVTEGNLYNPENADRVRHGTKLLNRLNDVDDCLQSGFTEAEVRRYASVYARKLLRGLFLPGEAKGAVADKVAAVNIEIRDTISAYLNKAVGLEVGIALRRQAMDVANDLVVDIANVYKAEIKAKVEATPDFNTTFGTASVDLDDEGFVKNSDDNVTLTVAPADSALKEVGSKVPTWYAETKDVEERLLEALGAISIDEYEAARKKHVGQAILAIDRAVANMNAANRLLLTPDGTPSLAPAINAVEAAQSDTTTLDSDYKKIRARRIEGLDLEEVCKDGMVKQWYCIE